VRATDAIGSAWGTPVVPDGLGNVGLYNSLAQVNGYPAIAYADFTVITRPDLKYVRATDAAGAAWGPAITLDEPGRTGLYPSMISSGGNCAIGYYNQSQALPYYISGVLTTLSANVTDISAYKKNGGTTIAWSVSNESGISKYEVERSADGRAFIFAGTVLPKANNYSSNQYEFFDAAVVNGTSYYRIKITDQSGAIKYTAIAKLNAANANRNTVIISPNPVQGKNIALQLNLQKGNYNVAITNSLGQRVYAYEMVFAGGAATKIFETNITVPGIYQLSIQGAGVNLVQKLVQH
jgi:hypothetical protein